MSKCIVTILPTKWIEFQGCHYVAGDTIECNDFEISDIEKKFKDSFAVKYQDEKKKKEKTVLIIGDEPKE